MADRSQSRGREFHSSGRGGLGNIRPSSTSRDRPIGGPDDFSSTRGREPTIEPTRIYSTGRGGAGNIRSPSRDHREHVGPNSHEKEIVRDHARAERDAPQSFGRGGLGNISRSRSRGPAPVAPPNTHSPGRGSMEGAGPIYEEKEQPPLGPPRHSAEHPANQPGGHEPFGSRNRSASRDPEHPGSSKDRHGISGLLHKVTHPTHPNEPHN
ncbi:uncharacterized protein BT62DRAFT_929439 [Guyanagaster necrorhizus]|uniref:Uncharacterized protein n=1 Tax=Guyanagaster necrorhizus TaxID=856835 RepID=A0A9P8AVE4_9AGAR|nr:uncharacterized protein BT62DRAFT_929439 [Guyanagaster necrorhizus MCA 3950]KAG7449479.1 hypothetical protein BT62DRAFT_929439 [Guyanagaster necrorhizus MCA 3950]